MNDLICQPWLDLQEEILENRKTYRQFEKEISEGLMDDVKKEIENGEMYEIVANTIMISKWTGIRKSTASHMKGMITNDLMIGRMMKLLKHRSLQLILIKYLELWIKMKS